MASFIVDLAGAAEHPAARAEIERRLRGGEFFWLDLHGPDPDDLEMLRELFDLHPLALAEAAEFGHRARLVQYGAVAYLVVYGAAAGEEELVEVHCLYTERYLVTVRREHCPPLDRLRAPGRRAIQPAAPFVLHWVLESLVDSFFPVLDEIDDRIDELEDTIFAGPTQAQLQMIFRLKRRLVAMRRAIAPERDLLRGVAGGIAELPGMTPDAERYVRDLYDRMLRVADQIDSYRDLMTGAMDVYLSTVSNRLNAVMKTLTLVATIFLPLTFLTGFFGQNFRWLVERVGGLPAFVVLGIVLEVAVVAALLFAFRRFRLT